MLQLWPVLALLVRAAPVQSPVVREEPHGFVVDSSFQREVSSGSTELHTGGPATGGGRCAGLSPDPSSQVRVTPSAVALAALVPKPQNVKETFPRMLRMNPGDAQACGTKATALEPQDGMGLIQDCGWTQVIQGVWYW